MHLKRSWPAVSHLGEGVWEVRGALQGCVGKGLAPTHSCRLKGTPSTSNRSISKSTPMVAL